MSTKLKTTEFKAQLAAYKQAIDDDIAEYSKLLARETLQEYGISARMEIDAYLSILSRGGKRIRGALVMAGYEMCGGTDKQMIIQAARAIEMIHAYILIVDDFQDRSATRRGGPTAHRQLAKYHQSNKLAGSAEHFGASIALDAALSGAHSAQEILMDLGVDPMLRLQASRLVNQTMVTTAHGQTLDLINQVVAEAAEYDIEQVLVWKTAHYTFMNPLSVGMTLAGATTEQIETTWPYALNAGKAFQITDDILGTFGDQESTGKNPMDDIREGKRTIITAYALEHASAAEKKFLTKALGKANITEPEFQQCKNILVHSGALEFARQSASEYVAQAIQELHKNSNLWSEQGTAFLEALATYLVDRAA